MAPLRSLGDAAEGLDSGAHGSPLHGLAVLPLGQQVLPAPVVGVLVEHPDALQHPAGVDLTDTALVHDGWAVLGGLEHLPTEISLLEHLDVAPASTRLEETREKIVRCLLRHRQILQGMGAEPRHSWAQVRHQAPPAHRDGAERLLSAPKKHSTGQCPTTHPMQRGH